MVWCLSAAAGLSCTQACARSNLQVVVLALVAYGKYRDDATALDLRKNHITSGAEWNDELAQKRAACAGGLPIAERGPLEAGGDGWLPARSASVGSVASVSSRNSYSRTRSSGSARESDAKRHFPAAVRLDFFSMPCRRPSTLAADA